MIPPLMASQNCNALRIPPIFLMTVELFATAVTAAIAAILEGAQIIASAPLVGAPPAEERMCTQCKSSFTEAAFAKRQWKSDTRRCKTCTQAASVPEMK